ncbi:sensor histidine kinase [Haloarchaeobius sp. DFWS5]|uniref:sensor histidine kinase n=1 Tax=Haloarchaeobius sp. DFWS5 TaxID=3446114 RepID=UPI003EB7001E
MRAQAAERSVLVVDSDESERATVVAALTAHESAWTVTGVSQPDSLPVDEVSSVDCIVTSTVTDEEWQTLFRSPAFGERRPPVVVYTDLDGDATVESLLRAGADSVLRKVDGPQAMALSVASAMRCAEATGGKERPESSQSVRRKVEDLHGVATSFVHHHTEAEIFRAAVDAADSILSFDMCYIGVVRDGDIYTAAANDSLLEQAEPLMSIDEGIAGKTYRTGRTFVVDHPSEDPDSNPITSDILSALSIPIDDIGVFQSLSRAKGGFTTTDVEIAELLVAHVRSAIERIRYEEALRAERDRFAALFENVPEPAAHYEIEGGQPLVQSANPAFVETFGFEPGRPLAELVRPVGSSDEALEHHLEREKRLDVVVERATATGRRTFLVRNAPVTSDSDRTTGYVIYTDISDLKRREQQLHRQNERLSEFANIVSHDLRNPLAVAGGYLSEARASSDDENLAEVATALDEMERFIDELLALAHQGQVADEPTETSLAAVVDRAWANVETATASIVGPGEGTIVADPDRLQQLLENLFRNSVEHSSTGSHSEAADDDEDESTNPQNEDTDVVEDRTDSVTISVAFCNESGDFEVVDDGLGIPEDRRERVFEAGVTWSDEGTGIGLSVVKQIAEAHGWCVTVDEGPAGGARFVFTGVGETRGNPTTGT